MSKYKQSKGLKTIHFATLSVFLVLIFSLELLCQTSVSSPAPVINQTQEKNIKVWKMPPDAPIQITDLQNEGQAISYEKVFLGGDDWMKEIGFKLKNISDKNIVYVSIGFNLPQTSATGNPMDYRAVYGQYPKEALFYRDGTPFKVFNSRPRLKLEPGKLLDVNLDAEYDKLKAFVESRQPIFTLNTFDIHIVVIYFEDGTQWSPAGGYAQPDPNNPGRYIPIQVAKDTVKPN